MQLPTIDPDGAGCACGRDPETVTPIALPHTGDVPGECLIEPERPTHYSFAVHPRYRPDVVAVSHGFGE